MIVTAECMIYKSSNPGKDDCFKQCLLLITNRRLFLFDKSKMPESAEFATEKPVENLSLDHLTKSPGLLLHSIDISRDVIEYESTVKFEKVPIENFAQRHRLKFRSHGQNLSMLMIVPSWHSDEFYHLIEDCQEKSFKHSVDNSLIEAFRAHSRDKRMTYEVKEEKTIRLMLYVSRLDNEEQLTKPLKVALNQQ